MHMRRCTHWPPTRRQSSHPWLLGDTSETCSRCAQAWLIGPPHHASARQSRRSRLVDTTAVIASSAITAVVLVAAIPLGIAAGRLSWLDYAERIGVKPEAVVRPRAGSGRQRRPIPPKGA